MVSKVVAVVRRAIVRLLRTVLNAMIKPVNVDASQVLLGVNVIDACQAIGITRPKGVCVS